MSIDQQTNAGVDPQGVSTVQYLAKEYQGLGFPLDHTVLLIIDPVNDFLSEGGAGWQLTKTTVVMNSVIANLKRLIDGARSRGIPVLFGPMAYTKEDYADKALHRRSGINRIMFENKMFLAGSWGADFHPDLQPHPDDVILLPHKGIDVFESDLPEHLERFGATHLLIAGMTANLCCESTGRHAMERGYDVTFVSDAIGAESVMAYEASIRVNYPLVANAVMTVDECLAGMDRESERSAAAQAGDSVRGSDDGDIGTIERVVPADGETEGHVVVPRGLIFTEDLFIPFDAVTRRVGMLVYVNVPKLVVSSLPWKQPPRLHDRTAKEGPPSQQVAQLYASRSATAHQPNGSEKGPR